MKLFFVCYHPIITLEQFDTVPFKWQGKLYKTIKICM